MYFKNFVFVFFVSVFISLPEFIYANNMPGIWDYTLISAGVAFVLGFIIASVAVLLHSSFSKNKLEPDKYLKLWLKIFLSIPAVVILIFLSIIIFT